MPAAASRLNFAALNIHARFHEIVRFVIFIFSQRAQVRDDMTRDFTFEISYVKRSSDDVSVFGKCNSFILMF